MKIGIFVCHCGSNIAGTVDVEKVARTAKEMPAVTISCDYKYMCSEPGQAMIIKAIKEHKLDRIIVAACSPKLHETTFRKCVENAGLNPFMVEMANIREHCSWVHPKEEATTAKAADIVKLNAGKISKIKPLHKMKVPIERKALVIGGGIAGIQSALSIGSAGFKVTLVEKNPELGGHRSEFRKTFPAMDETSVMDEALKTLAENPDIKVVTNAGVQNVSGYIGNFDVKIKCNEKNEIIDDKFGAIVVAAGFSVSDYEGYGRDENIINSVEFEKQLAAGKVVRPSDKREVKDVVFIQCAGSRGQGENSVTYCSKICCMYTAKQALLFTRNNPEGQAYIFYKDIVAAGKDHEQFIQNVREQERILYLNGNVSEINPGREKLSIIGNDVLSGVDVEIDADLVVLASPLVPKSDSTELAQKLGIPYDKNKFFTELHAKLAPVETVTKGIFLAGSCQAPKDIADTLSSASAASAKVLGLFNLDYYEAEPLTACVDPNMCNACFDCKTVCTFRAIETENTKDGREVAKVIESMCQGCGNCVTICRSGAIDLAGFTDEQIMKQIEYGNL